MRLPERRRRSVVLPAPFAATISRGNCVFYAVHTSYKKCPAARWQVEEDLFQPARAIREEVTEVLHVNGRRNLFFLSLVRHLEIIYCEVR
jgi:hypothetical protein